MKPLFTALEQMNSDNTSADSELIQAPDIDLSQANIEEDVLALDNAQRGIQTALEDAKTLVDLRDNLGDAPDTQTLRIARIAIESIMRRTQALATVDIPSLEAIGNNNVYAAESIGSVIEAIIDAIKRTLKWIYDKIMGIFQSKTVESRARKIERNYESALEKVVSGKMNTPITKVSTIHHFGFLGSELTPKVIHSYLDDVQQTVDTLNKLAVLTHDAANRMLDYVEKRQDGFGANMSEFADILADLYDHTENNIRLDSTFQPADYSPVLQASDREYRTRSGLTHGRLVVLLEETRRSPIEGPSGIMIADETRLRMVTPNLPVTISQMDRSGFDSKNVEDIFKSMLQTVNDTQKHLNDWKNNNEKTNARTEKIMSKLLDNTGPSTNSVNAKSVSVFYAIIASMTQLHMDCVNAIMAYSASVARLSHIFIE